MRSSKGGMQTSAANYSIYCPKCGKPAYRKDEHSSCAIYHHFSKHGSYSHEIKALRNRVDMLSKDNAELIHDNLELRARHEKAIELPCKIGDTVYQVLSQWDSTECLKNKFVPKVREKKVVCFYISNDYNIVLVASCDHETNQYLVYRKDVFINRKKAKKC